jgi:Family of unknown function (DUF5317)
VLAPLAVVLGAVAGLLARAGGRRPPRVRAAVLVLAGAALEVTLEVTNVAVPGGFAALAAAVLLAGVVANLRLVGAPVVAVGLAANLLVIGLNGGMPVRSDALAAAGLAGPGGGRHVADAGTRLGVLGAIVPVPGVPLVVTFGDLVAMVGLADVTANAVRARRRRNATGDADAGVSAERERADRVVIDLATIEREAAPQPAMATARPAHDWGTAPRPVPSSASQYSARPDATAPEPAMAASRPAASPSPARRAASHSR